MQACIHVLAVSQVDYYGAPTPLKQLAGISVPDSSMLVVQPYDTGAMDEIERGILQSDLGINPTNDGKILRLNIPQLTAVSHNLPICCASYYHKPHARCRVASLRCFADTNQMSCLVLVRPMCHAS